MGDGNTVAKKGFEFRCLNFGPNKRLGIHNPP